MKLTRQFNWITFATFFLVQLLPNVLFRPFIFHEIGPLLPDIFTFHGSRRHPVSGFSFFLQHPLLFSYDFPVMAVAFLWPLLPFAQAGLRARLFAHPALAALGIIAGYVVEVLTYDMRVLHGHWSADWLEGFAFHAYFCFWTLVSVFVAYGLSLCVSFLIRPSRLTLRSSEPAPRVTPPAPPPSPTAGGAPRSAGR